MPAPPAATGAIVVVGASTRPLAASAARAGWQVHAADLFADLDLRESAASAVRVRPYPEGLPAAVTAFPAGPWFYTGAMENHPEIINAISQTRPLAGSDIEAVTRVRDPAVLAAALKEVGLRFPETRRDQSGLPQDGSWLAKSLRSAGGHGISRWRGPAREEASPVDRVWQRRVSGHDWSAAFLLGDGAGRLVGVSRQLLGRRWCHARPFAYAGSIDIDHQSLSPEMLAQLELLGSLLAIRFGLVGLVGVDFVIDSQWHIHVIEVNPRPTASMELIERATGFSLAAAHLTACGLRAAHLAIHPRSGSWSKAILFAAEEIAVDEAVLHRLRAAAGPAVAGWPMLADIPSPPQVIPAGGPVCTIFAHAPSPRE